MNIFSIDESGYTGRDLLQQSQTWQGASALKISYDDAMYLIKQHFPKRQAPELKFSSLKKRDSYQKPIFNLQKELFSNFQYVTCVADKRFLLVQMFIEYAVEPFYYDHGVNLYENGGNVNLASMAYYVCQSYFGRKFDKILMLFQNAMHEKTEAAVKSLVENVRAIEWKLLPEVLGPIALEHPDCIKAIMNPKVSTDAAFIILQALISRTELMSDGPYSIEHDRSKNLLQYNKYLSMLINCEAQAEFKISEIASVKFPLKLNHVDQVDSKNSPPVQLCDVMIGSAISAVYQLLIDKSLSYYSPLKLYEGNHLIHFLPDIDFKEQQAYRRNAQGNEYINFIAEQFNKFGN